MSIYSLYGYLYEVGEIHKIENNMKGNTIEKKN